MEGCMGPRSEKAGDLKNKIPPGSFDLKLVTQNGTQLTSIRMNYKDTVSKLMDEVQKQTGIDPNAQDIRFAGKSLTAYTSETSKNKDDPTRLITKSTPVLLSQYKGAANKPGIFQKSCWQGVVLICDIASDQDVKPAFFRKNLKCWSTVKYCEGLRRRLSTNASGATVTESEVRAACYADACQRVDATGDSALGKPSIWQPMTVAEQTSLGLPKLTSVQNARALLCSEKPDDHARAVDAYLDAINILDSTGVALHSDDVGQAAKAARDDMLEQAKAWAAYVVGAGVSKNARGTADGYRPTLRDHLAADYEHQLPEVEMRIHIEATGYTVLTDGIEHLSAIRKQVRELKKEGDELAAKSTAEDFEKAVDKYTTAVLLIDEADSSMTIDIGADLRQTREKLISVSNVICRGDTVDRILPPYNRDGCHTNVGRRKRGVGAWCQC